MYIVLLVLVVAASAGAAVYFLMTSPSQKGGKHSLSSDVGKLNTVDPQKLTRDPKTGVVFVRDEVMVIFKDGVSEAEVQKKVESLKGEIVGYIKGTRDYQVRIEGNISAEELRDMVNKLNKDPSVEAATLNILYEMNTTKPNDPGWNDDWDEKNPAGSNWGLEAIYAPSAWDKSSRGERVRIGVVDGGFKIDHEDLQVPASNASGDEGRYYAIESDAPQPLWEKLLLGSDYKGRNNHGTHVSGTIGAIADNGKGITGIAWNRDLILFRTSFSAASIRFGITWAVTHGAKVVNLSLGAEKPLSEEDITISDRYWSAVMNELGDKDFLIVQAAGNSHAEARTSGMFCAVSDPKLREKIIVVGAIKLERGLTGGFNYAMARFSSYGSSVDLVAPGVGIFSTLFYEPNYGSMDGTSMAAPHVTGVSALVWGTNPALHASDVKKIIVQAADRPIDYKGREYKILNAKTAVDKASATLPFKGPIVSGSDTAFVLDVSGSMEGQKIEDAKNAAVELVNMIQNEANTQNVDHQIGLVTFTTSSSINMDVSNQMDAVRTAIQGLKSQESTNMEAGIRDGTQILEGCPPNRKRIMLLLSDGQPNVGASDEKSLLGGVVADAQTAGITINTIGFGSAGDLNVDLLKAIANATGGTYSYAKGYFGLASAYVAMRHEATGKVILKKVAAVPTGSQVRKGSFEVLPGQGELNGTLNWSGAQSLELVLKDPDGTVVDSDYVGAQMVYEQQRFAQYIIKNPKPGIWRIEVRPKGAAKGASGRDGGKPYALAAGSDFVNQTAQVMQSDNQDKGQGDEYQVVFSTRGRKTAIKEYTQLLLIVTGISLVLALLAFLFFSRRVDPADYKKT